MSTLGGQNFRKQGIFRENFLAAPSAPLKFALFIIFFADMGGGQNPILPPLDSALGALAPPCPTEKRVWGGGELPQHHGNGGGFSSVFTFYNRDCLGTQV